MNSPEPIVGPLKTPTQTTAGTWPAQLSLHIGRRGESSRLQRCHHSGPLYVQRAFYPEGEDLAHLYLLHPPGGVVSGDSLHIRVDCAEQARALVTTPGAGRIYRARDARPEQRQRAELRLADGASLEWFPLETIVYDGACVDMTTDVQLGRDSCFIGWELTCFGLPAARAPFTSGSFRQRYRIHRQGLPLFVDGLSIDASNRAALLQGTTAMRGHAVSGFFLAGPFAADVLDDTLMEALRMSAGQCSPLATGARMSQPAEAMLAVTRVGDMLLGRYLGPSAEGARRHFTRWWELLRPVLLKRAACAPRIWLT